MGRPCLECPWRRDVAPGQFPPERYIALAPTCAPGGFEAVFACHMTPEGGERACAGMLAVCGEDSNRVRMAVIAGALAPPPWPAPEGVALVSGFPELAERNGVSPDHPALACWRKERRGR